MPDNLPNPHDRYFRETFSDLAVARDFMRYYLPGDVSALIDLNRVTLVDGSFVDAALQDHVSDMLYHVGLHTTENPGLDEAFIYVLVEHKSYADRLTAFQVLRYIVRIWERILQEEGRLMSVFPVVLYHGENAWNAPADVADLVDAPSSVRPYVPSLRYHLCDLSTYDLGAITGGIHARLALRLLHSIFSPDLGAQLPDILRLVNELTEPKTALQWVETALRYVAAAGRHVSRDDIIRAVDDVMKDEGSNILPTVAEQWIEEGKQIGLEQGLERGREQLLHAAVDLLEARFGPLPQELHAAISQLSMTRLQQLIVAALNFASTDDALRFVADMTDA